MKYVLKLQGIPIGEYPSQEEAERGIEIELSLSSREKRENYSIDEELLGIGIF